MRNRSSRQFEADSLEMSVRFIFPARSLLQETEPVMWGNITFFQPTTNADESPPKQAGQGVSTASTVYKRWSVAN